MSEKYSRYQALDYPLPESTSSWNMYGAGIEYIGRNNRPEEFRIPEPDADQLLVRVDCVGMCFSDVKLIRQGGSHPKLYQRDLSVEPTRLGHEAALTVIKVGANLTRQYSPGQRLAMQPDIYQNGKSTAYGYTIPGGLIQYHLIGEEILDTDAGACLLPLAGELGYAETALLEPWGCVVAAYTQRRRLEPKTEGVMWIVGRPGDTYDYQFSTYLDRPATIVLTDVPASIHSLATAAGTEVVVRDGVQPQDYASLAAEYTQAGFDDIVLLEPHSAHMVAEAAKTAARRGTININGRQPLDGLVESDAGRLHYDYIAFIGHTSTDIAAAYGEDRNRCELQSRGSAIFIGAGGPMGMMHVQRAIELPNGPQLIIATEVNEMRLQALAERFTPLAEKHGRKLITFNPASSEQTLHQLTMQLTDGQGADDVVVSVPVASLMAEAGTLMNSNGMLVLFAGVPNGTMVPLNLSDVYLHNAQLTGTSGLTIDDQASVMERTLEGNLSPSRSVAAIGGMEAAQDGIQAMMNGRYPGKIVIFPQIRELPLLGIDELPEKYPEIAAKLGPDDTWTVDAEAALIDLFWEGV